ncbi:MAG: DUF4347 domain-containing protein, partial [Gammaproteobacteria bacterium]
MHSADLIPGALVDAAAAPQIEVRLLDMTTETTIGHTEVNHATSRELVVIDKATPDYQQLVDDVLAQADHDREIEFLLIEAGDDGIQRIADALSGMRGVDAIHIISHGRDGTVQLGASELNLDALRQRESLLTEWSNALNAQADLLIYGCNVAETETGRLFIDELARITGADVGASDNVTGYPTGGGDWDLEYRAGTIEAALAVSPTLQQSWQGMLANAAPILVGANTLTAINEDATTNGGTSISGLIAGRVTDADPGALTGIAVTAVDNTNG